MGNHVSTKYLQVLDKCVYANDKQQTEWGGLNNHTISAGEWNNINSIAGGLNHQTRSWIKMKLTPMLYQCNISTWNMTNVHKFQEDASRVSSWLHVRAPIEKRRPHLSWVITQPTVPKHLIWLTMILYQMLAQWRHSWRHAHDGMGVAPMHKGASTRASWTQQCKGRRGRTLKAHCSSRIKEKNPWHCPIAHCATTLNKWWQGLHKILKFSVTVWWHYS